MRSLVVEDDHLNRAILQNFLSKHGACDICVNGEEAVSAFRRSLNAASPYHLVVLDIWLPLKNGKDVLREMRQAEKEGGVAPRDEAKVIVLTVDDDPELIMDVFRRCGATDYLLKPVDLNRLEGLLGELGLAPV